MREFGEEVIIESTKLPWLIWIQLLITILIFLLLFFGFTIFTSDDSPSSTSSAAASPPCNSGVPPLPHFTNPNTNSSHRRTRHPNVEDHRGVSRNDGELITEEGQSGEEPSSSKNLMFFRFHPCNYFGALRRAFLKCFGFDTGSSSRSHEKQE